MKSLSVVLLGTVHFVRVAEGMFDKAATFPAGEGICCVLPSLTSVYHSDADTFWLYHVGADALLWALDQLGYPYLIIGGENHNETNAILGRVYELLGEDVSMVLGDFLSGQSVLIVPRVF